MEENQYENRFCDVTLACDDKQIWPHNVISESTSPDISYLDFKVEEVKSIDVIHLDGEGQENINFGQIGYYYEYEAKKLEKEVQLKSKFPRYKNETKFPCNQCPKKFKEKTILKIHIQSLEYSFACKLCSKSFTQSREFMMQIHTFKDHPLLQVKNKISKLGVNDQNFIHQVF